MWKVTIDRNGKIEKELQLEVGFYSIERPEMVIADGKLEKVEVYFIELPDELELLQKMEFYLILSEIEFEVRGGQQQ